LNVERPQVAASVPPLRRDWAFWGIVTTQALNAFNDNVFKQMVLLICVEYKLLFDLPDDRYQSIAQLLFTLPFVLLAGSAGYLSDRLSKRRIILVVKWSEVVLMAAGAIVLLTVEWGSRTLLALLIVLLTLMAIRSALFGPSKYGILPELFRDHDLPKANGAVQMTTLLSIIFGIALAGVLFTRLFGEMGDRLWVIGLFTIAVSIAGVWSATWIRPTPVAEPNLRFRWSSTLVDKSAWASIIGDRLMCWVLVVYAVFWFAGAVVVLAVNSAGHELGLAADATSIVAACLGLGTGLGCMFSGGISKGAVRFDLVRWGAVGLVVSLAAASQVPRLAGWAVEFVPEALGTRGAALAITLLAAGFCGGVMAVPLQVFLQERAPIDQKGRIMGAMNLITWIGILLAAPHHFVCSLILGRLEASSCWTFLTLSAVIGLVAIGSLGRRMTPRAAQG